MQSVQQQLEEYRRTRKAAQEGGGVAANSSANGEASPSSSSATSFASNNDTRPSLLTKVSQQLTDSRLFRSYRTFQATYPWPCRAVIFILWLCGLWIFASIEFGSVYFAVSVLISIYASLRSEPKKKGEVSAYSVFNPNCERLPGQMTAEHFESELLRRNVPRRS